MTAVDLSAIRAQLAGIEAPWDCDGFTDGAIVNLSIYEGTNQGRIVAADITRESDAAFIAAAPSTVAGLLAMVERVEALHTMEHAEVPVWQYGIKSGGEVCSLDGQAWPCETIAAITGEGGADGP